MTEFNKDGDIITGFEGKSLKTTIINWLYTKDINIRVDASLEMRRYFLRIWKKPDWFTED